jgi:hypothetical protein
MRNLLRSLVLAIVLAAALAGVSSVKALSGPPSLEACVNGGTCSVNTDVACVTRGQCPLGENCICN